MDFTLSSNGKPLLIEQSVSTTNAYILLFTNFNVGPVAQLRFPLTVPFLQKNSGIYLGDKTPIQILINGVYKYFEIIEEQKGSNPALVRPVDVLGSKPLNLAIFQRQTNNVYKIGSEIILEGINIIEGVDINAELKLKSPSSSEFIYSVAQCNTTNECSECSSVACPDSFSCINGTCQKSSGADPSMGLRYSKNNEMNILTVKKDTGNTYTFEFISSNDIYPNYRGEQVETWVFAELPPGDTELQVSISYPLYILSGTTKIYFTEAKVNGNKTVYTGTTNKDVGGVITFTPTKIGDWRQFTFSTNDFQNLTISGLTGESIALWQNPNMAGKSVVISKKPGNLGKTKPFYKTWWFWLIVALVIVLLAIIIIVLVHVGSKNKNH